MARTRPSCWSFSIVGQRLVAGHRQVTHPDAGRPVDGVGDGGRVNQTETHPFFQRQDYQQLLAEHGVQIESWNPFAERRNNLFTDPTLSEIGAAHGKSVAQVVLRWLIRRNVVVIPKSVRSDRMRKTSTSSTSSPRRWATLMSTAPWVDGGVR
jgi:hypothetical protein